MSNSFLRVFSPDDDSADRQKARRQRELDRLAGAAEPKMVALPLGKMVPLLLDASRHDCGWLVDFADDIIRIDADLYDVLLAYSQMRSSAAA